MKYLCPEVPWAEIKAVGFDLDGTLYDEFDFITQVYPAVARELTGAPDLNPQILTFMRDRWLERGSSYPHIFRETLAACDAPAESWDDRIARALKVFRAFRPTLTLSPRVEYLLQRLTDAYPLFLISDGNSALQRAKLEALGAGRYFRPENIFVSGDRGVAWDKPSIDSITEVAALSAITKPDTVVYVGDRDRDREFALRAGFHFVDVRSLFRHL